MKCVKKTCTLLATAGMLSLLAVSPAFARTRLDGVMLDFSVGALREDTYPELTVTPGEQSLYEVVSAVYVDYVNPYTNQPNRYPTAEIVIKSKGDYYFRVSAESYFELYGMDVEYVDSRKSGDSTTMTLTVEFPEMGSSSIAAPAYVNLTDDGLASWAPVGDASEYEVTLVRDGKADLSTRTIVSGTSFNIAPLISRASTYSVRVVAISRYDNRVESSYVQPGTITVDDAKLEDFARAAESYASADGQWIETDSGTWYQNPDGTWPASCWQQIDGNWYFFNSHGYRQTGWILWNNQYYCCDSEGKMLADTITPDGYPVDASGVWQKNSSAS